MQLQSLGDFGVSGYDVLFLTPAISRRVMALGGIERRKLGNFRARLGFTTAGNARGAAIKLNERLVGGKVFFVSVDGLCKFLAGFLCDRQAGKNGRRVCVLAENPSTPF